MAISQKTCAVEGCNNCITARGLCNAHYRRMKKGIDPHTDKTPLQIYGAKCSVCGDKAYGKGLCSKHYNRWRRNGTTEIDGTAPGDVIRWIEGHIKYEGKGCLVWPFSRSDVTGFGTLTYKGESHRAHRFMCRLAHGEPPTPQHHAAHSCGKGHIGCVNPRHLRWATPAENAADKVLHGTDPRGERQGQSKLTENDVLKIRQMLRDGVNQAEISSAFKVSRAAIGNIKNRRSWAWLD